MTLGMKGRDPKTTRRPWGPQRTCPCHASEDPDLNRTGPEEKQKPPGKAGARGPGVQAVEVNAQIRTLPPPSDVALGAECTN